MLSRRTLFTLGLSRVAERVEEQLEAERLNPTPPAPPSPRAKPRVPPRPPGVPPPRPSWPHKQGAELWAPASEALPRPAGERVLEVDELDFDLAWLPLDDGEFDGAVSAFAPMFSSDGQAAIGELFRVVRPGGFVAFTAWTPAGIVGRLLALAEEHEPSAPGTRPPMSWGRVDALREALEPYSDEFELRPGGLTLRFTSSDEALDALFGALRPLAWAPRKPELRTRAAEIVAEAADVYPGAVTLRATYVMAVARTRSA
jgi:SAM-dependent methyltransferase